MTRYFIVLPEAISLLFKAAELSVGGEIFVMRMPSYRIYDVAQVLIEASGIQNVEIKEIGMRPGEKIDEVLVSEYEAGHTFNYDSHYYIIMPTIKLPDPEAHYSMANLVKVDFNKYTSADHILDKDEVKVLLQKGNYLP